VIHWLSNDPEDTRFPPSAVALPEPNGLLAAGGHLTPARLLAAYRRGIFPWYEQGQPVLWWTPDPRAVLLPEELKITRSLRKTLRNGGYEVSADQAFGSVIDGCAAPRADAGTWITGEMGQAYRRLHELGHAHSIEAWHAGRLVGGLYGVAVGQVFFGESMFSRKRDASKIALVHLVTRLREMGYGLIDCQLPTSHLASMGSRLVPRQEFESMLDELCAAAPEGVAWPEGPAPPRLPRQATRRP
jgi:leucyl/phenylalanyl-tRNA--protein transferase